MKFNHFDQNGNAVMVDVSEKQETERIAVAEGTIYVNEEIFSHIKAGSTEKGDVLGVARVAGIMATKRTGDLIPMCHPLMLTKSAVDFLLNDKEHSVTAVCTVKLVGKTGVEMEALTGVSVEDEGILLDADTREAYERMICFWQKHFAQKEQECPERGRDYEKKNMDSDSNRSNDCFHRLYTENVRRDCRRKRYHCSVVCGQESESCDGGVDYGIQ